jgi:hypothetical protein
MIVPGFSTDNSVCTGTVISQFGRAVASDWYEFNPMVPFPSALCSLIFKHEFTNLSKGIWDMLPPFEPSDQFMEWDNCLLLSHSQLKSQKGSKGNIPGECANFDACQ